MTSKREKATTEDLVCPNCGMEKENWLGDNGRGYRMNGKSYCCQDCAEDKGCTCIE